MTGWLMLLAAGVMEIVWAASLAQSQGFTRLWPSVLVVVAIAASMALMAGALRTIPLGTGYAIWTGMGAAGTAIYGMVMLGESADPARLGCVALIVAGIVGLKFATP